MFKKLFKNQQSTNEVTLYSPLNGKIVPLEEVPDPVFSQKMMGEGIAIEPNAGEVLAPVDGEIIQLFHTKHAIGIKTVNGAEILIHVGLETVNLNGEGFTAHVEQGSKVKKGEKLISFNKELIEEKAKSSITPIIVTNTDDMEEIKVLGNGEITTEDELMVTKKKES